jgi:osmotically inducible lipoprotein OsmB
MKTFAVMTVALTAGLMLAACGESRGDRAISGAGIGAGIGAAAGALSGGNVATGAALGGAAGAAAGGLTKSKDVDLGKPVWR